MKTQRIKKTLLIAAAAVFVWIAWKSQAQDTVAAQAMPNGVYQVIQLEQAKISDGTIIAYIKSTADTYSLNASQILFLRQQGVSDAVITAMLTQPKAAPANVPVSPVPAASPAPPVDASTAVVPTATAPATVTYVQTAPAPVSYYYPYYYPYGYYYGWPHPVVYPWVGAGWGWRGGWRVGVRF